MIDLQAVQQLIRDVRQLAKKYPEAVYRRPEGPDVLCAYDSGRVEHGPATPGCLIGQAGRRQPELWRLLCSEPREQIDQLLCGTQPEQFDVADDEMVWLEHLQSWQDAGLTWSEAVRAADEEYGRLCTEKEEEQECLPTA